MRIDTLSAGLGIFFSRAKLGDVYCTTNEEGKPLRTVIQIEDSDGKYLTLYVQTDVAKELRDRLDEFLR